VPPEGLVYIELEEINETGKKNGKRTCSN